MRLTDDFFVEKGSSVTKAGFTSTIQLNTEHIIYTAHFPGFPVTPGVIQLQIVDELLEKHIGKKVKLIEMPQCKFVKILNPVETPSIDVEVDISQKDDFLQIKAWGKKETDYFFKLNSIFQITNEP